MSTQYIAINTDTDAVEAIGTEDQVLTKLFENFGMVEIRQLIKVYELSVEVKIDMGLKREFTPAC